MAGPMRHVWPRLEQQALRSVHRALLGRAGDMTAETAGRSALMLAPHADDETLGCGATIALKRRAGTPVTVAVATDGRASHRHERWTTLSREDLPALRERETRAATGRLGLDGEALHFLGLPDGELAGVADRLEAAIAALIEETAPQEVYAPALADGHPDHRALARAARALLARGALGGAQLYEYPVWVWDFRSWRPEGASNKGGYWEGRKALLAYAASRRPVRVGTAELMALKREALMQHRSQLGLLPEEPDWSGLPEDFLAYFLNFPELFFEVTARDQAS